MNPLPEYTRIRTTNFVTFDCEGTIPAGIEGVIIHYLPLNNSYVIESAFKDESLVGGYRYDVADVSLDDFEVIK